MRDTQPSATRSRPAVAFSWTTRNRFREGLPGSQELSYTRAIAPRRTRASSPPVARECIDLCLGAPEPAAGPDATVVDHNQASALRRRSTHGSKHRRGCGQSRPRASTIFRLGLAVCAPGPRTRWGIGGAPSASRGVSRRLYRPSCGQENGRPGTRASSTCGHVVMESDPLSSPLFRLDRQYFANSQRVQACSRPGCPQR
mmetsp:Transcript_32013/g.98813  ORF Transcript_32013/g.98813 Transcript_32013/m.98813 type:complete len:200 (+) Transcript_32013:737-1336(+)